MEDKENKFNKPVIRKCRYCNSNYEVKTGLGNFKNLFRKPTWDDWFILFMIAMALIGSYFYYHDVKACHETLNNLNKVCERYILAKGNVENTPTYISPNLSYYNFSMQRVNNEISKINSIPLLPNGTK